MPRHVIKTTVPTQNFSCSCTKTSFHTQFIVMMCNVFTSQTFIQLLSTRMSPGYHIYPLLYVINLYHLFSSAFCTKFCHFAAHNFVYILCPKRLFENFTKESIQVSKQVSMKCGIYRSLQGLNTFL